MKIKNSLFLLAFFAMIFAPIIAWADDLNIVDVNINGNAPANNAELAIYFNLRNQDGTAIKDIKPDNCQITIDSITPKINKSEIKPFKDGSRGVAVLFIFPNSKNYSEEFFQIKSTLSTLSMMFDRPIDMLNAIPYDNTAKPMEWTSASEPFLKRSLQELTNTDEIEPNLFASFSPAIAMMNKVENVSQKYIVLISDAEGAIIGERERSLPLIASFIDELKANKITPIIVGYSPDGIAAMPNVDLIHRIATNAKGIYFQAENVLEFQKIVQKDVYDYIFTQYIYHASFDMDGKNYLEKGNYNLQFVVKANNGEEKQAIKIDWPALKKDSFLKIDDDQPKTDYTLIVIPFIGGLIIGIVVAIFISSRRRKKH